MVAAITSQCVPDDVMSLSVDAWRVLQSAYVVIHRRRCVCVLQIEKADIWRGCDSTEHHLRAVVLAPPRLSWVAHTTKTGFSAYGNRPGRFRDNAGDNLVGNHSDRGRADLLGGSVPHFVYGTVA